MEVMVTTGAIRRAKPQSDWHQSNISLLIVGMDWLSTAQTTRWDHGGVTVPCSIAPTDTLLLGYVWESAAETKQLMWDLCTVLTRRYFVNVSVKLSLCLTNCRCVSQIVNMLVKAADIGSGWRWFRPRQWNCVGVCHLGSSWLSQQWNSKNASGGTHQAVCPWHLSSWSVSLDLIFTFVPLVYMCYFCTCDLMWCSYINGGLWMKA